MRTADFINTLGIGTQLGNAGNTDAGRVDEMLDYLGISNVRQSAPTNPQTAALMKDLGQRGADFALIVNGNGTVKLQDALSAVAEMKPYLNAVEGPNEVDIFPIWYQDRQAYGFEGAMLFQEDLYKALRSDHSYDNIKVYTFSLANVLPSSNSSIRDMSAFADAASVHSYSPFGIRPAWVVPYGISGFDDLASRDPAVLTETGFYTLPGHRSWGGVTESVQARYNLDTVFGNALLGVERTYLFNLIDQPDPHNSEREAHFGMFRADYSAKPVATALHNVTTILADGGADAGSFKTKDVGYSVSGLPFTQASMQLQKSDGTHIIAVWNEEALWNYDSGTEIAAPHYNATIRLDRTYDTVRVYDPMVGSSPIATLHGVSSVTTDVSSHPVLIQLGGAFPGAVPAPVQAAVPPSPQALAVQAPAPASAPAPSTTGPDTLVLTVSEDAWKGDAQFVVKVDGQQVGGTHTATASHGARQSQEISLKGDWSNGKHTVAVTFVNDAWGGTPAEDRNLYIEKVSLNGTSATPSGTVTLYGPDTAEFSLGGGNKAAKTEGGSKSLVLHVSEDAWKGDAQFVVKVDGQQVGGTHTATASHGARQSQDIVLDGNWSTGQHRVSVEFLNDAYEGTPSTDRNLYVDGFEFAGTHHGGAVIYTGTAHFDIFG